MKLKTVTNNISPAAKHVDLFIQVETYAISFTLTSTPNLLMQLRTCGKAGIFIRCVFTSILVHGRVLLWEFSVKESNSCN